MATRRISDHPLHVTPEYVGAELGAPWRRMLAFVLDAALLVVPTLAVGLAAAALFLRHDDPQAYGALRLALQGHGAVERTIGEHAFMRALAPLFVRHESRGLPPAVAAAVEEGDLDKAADLLAGFNVSFGLNVLPEEGYEPPLPPKTIMLKVQQLIPRSVRVIVLLGVPALYFTIFTRRGATIGKWLAGLRVVRLDGERLSWGESFERFAGYLHVPGTFFVSLRDMWHDPNRRMPHDRVVHTAVIRHARVRAARTVAAGSLLLGLLALTSPIAAAADPPVEEIVAKVLAARGGATRLKAQETQRLAMKLTLAPGQVVPLRAEFKRPGRFRQELDLQGKTIVSAIDGAAGWTVNPLSGSDAVRPLGPDEVHNLAGSADFEGPLVDAAAKGNRVELAGHETIAGRPAWQLHVTLKGGETRDEYVDAATYLLVKWAGDVVQNGKPVRFETVFSDWRRVNGVMVAFRLVSGAAGGAQKQQIDVVSAEVDVPIDDARFARP